MRSSKLAFFLCAAVISSASAVFVPSASATGNDQCKVLTAEKFTQIMGYTATIDKTASHPDVLLLSRPHTLGWTIHDPHRDGLGAARRRNAQQEGLFASARQWPDRRLIPEPQN